jgi:hypothetical protein
MSEQLRIEILIALEAHDRSGSPYYVGDEQLSEKLGAPVHEIRRQMDLLEAQGLTRTANSHDGRRARISPQGMLVVERLVEHAAQAEEPPKPPIGFKTDGSA